MTSITAGKCLAILLAATAFPAAGQDNPLARRAPAELTLLRGYWNGANLEDRSNCATSGVNGQHGTYAQYFFTVTPPEMVIHETTVTNLTCDYAGTYTGDRSPSWTGTFTCTDGKRGTFESKGFLLTATQMQVRLQLKFQSSEGCDADAILGGSRF